MPIVKIFIRLPTSQPKKLSLNGTSRTLMETLCTSEILNVVIFIVFMPKFLNFKYFKFFSCAQDYVALKFSSKCFPIHCVLYVTVPTLPTWKAVLHDFTYRIKHFKILLPPKTPQLGVPEKNAWQYYCGNSTNHRCCLLCQPGIDWHLVICELMTSKSIVLWASKNLFRVKGPYSRLLQYKNFWLLHCARFSIVSWVS